MKGNKVFTLVCLSSLIMGNIPYQPIHATTSTTDVKEEQSTSVARKEVLSLFKDQTCTRLADGITQENIDQARAKVETVNQADSFDNKSQCYASTIQSEWIVWHFHSAVFL